MSRPVCISKRRAGSSRLDGSHLRSSDIIAAVKQHGLCLLTPAAFARIVQTTSTFKWRCQDGCSFSLKETEGGGNPRLGMTGRAGQERGDGQGHCISYCFRVCNSSPGSQPSIYYWEKIKEWASWCTVMVCTIRTHTPVINLQCSLSLTTVNHSITFISPKNVHILRHF